MPGLSRRQIQRNLDNVRFVRSLLHSKKQESHEQSQTRTGEQTLEDSQEADSGEG
jgi:hypothetical protein